MEEPITSSLEGFVRGEVTTVTTLMEPNTKESVTSGSLVTNAGSVKFWEDSRVFLTLNHNLRVEIQNRGITIGSRKKGPIAGDVIWVKAEPNVDGALVATAWFYVDELAELTMFAYAAKSFTESEKGHWKPPRLSVLQELRHGQMNDKYRAVYQLPPNVHPPHPWGQTITPLELLLYKKGKDTFLPHQVRWNSVTDEFLIRHSDHDYPALVHGLIPDIAADGWWHYSETAENSTMFGKWSRCTEVIASFTRVDARGITMRRSWAKHVALQSTAGELVSSEFTPLDIALLGSPYYCPRSLKTNETLEEIKCWAELENATWALDPFWCEPPYEDACPEKLTNLLASEPVIGKRRRLDLLGRVFEFTIQTVGSQMVVELKQGELGGEIHRLLVRMPERVYVILLADKRVKPILDVLVARKWVHSVARGTGDAEGPTKAPDANELGYEEGPLEDAFFKKSGGMSFLRDVGRGTAACCPHGWPIALVVDGGNCWRDGGECPAGCTIKTITPPEQRFEKIIKQLPVSTEDPQTWWFEPIMSEEQTEKGGDEEK